MSLTKTPTSMISTTGATAGQVLTYNASTTTWVASAVPQGGTAGNVQAWVNFNGTGAVGNQTIRASSNISSVYKNGTGNYTMFFTNALTDANYAVSCTTSHSNLLGNVMIQGMSATALNIVAGYANAGNGDIVGTDYTIITAQIIR